ncbi:hypothetical protein FGG08_001138 [Glutinoglossum americanum]|uniref:Transmembrane protein n=1 Tax=Glutinoglossum americanum TaxID=1670608 RepID=A0A9P8I2M3_9PEZI|nr:hypothetical protein FGG08_001138 [Glutinoglossum americanum]
MLTSQLPREWSNTPTDTSWHTVAKLAIPISFLIVFIALSIALSTRVRKSPREVSKAFRSLLGWVGGTRPRSRGGVRGAAPRRKKKRKDLALEDDDFWEAHVEGRERRYRIPGQNRRAVGKRKGEGR